MSLGIFPILRELSDPSRLKVVPAGGLELPT